jgi:hypothetical protein
VVWAEAKDGLCVLLKGRIVPVASTSPASNAIAKMLARNKTNMKMDNALFTFSFSLSTGLISYSNTFFSFIVYGTFL